MNFRVNLNASYSSINTRFVPSIRWGPDSPQGRGTKWEHVPDTTWEMDASCLRAQWTQLTAHHVLKIKVLVTITVPTRYHYKVSTLADEQVHGVSSTATASKTTTNATTNMVTAQHNR